LQEKHNIHSIIKSVGSSPFFSIIQCSAHLFGYLSDQLSEVFLKLLAAIIPQPFALQDLLLLFFIQVLWLVLSSGPKLNHSNSQVFFPKLFASFCVIAEHLNFRV
jgi:hypothetical protein